MNNKQIIILVLGLLVLSLLLSNTSPSETTNVLTPLNGSDVLKDLIKPIVYRG